MKNLVMVALFSKKSKLVVFITVVVTMIIGFIFLLNKGGSVSISNGSTSKNSDYVIFKQNEGVEETAEMIDLKGFDTERNKFNIDLLLEKIATYPNNINDFTFQESYSDFFLESNGSDEGGLYAYYSLNNVAYERSYDARIELLIFETQVDSKQYLRDYVLLRTSSMSVFSSFAFGDLSVGYTFIRGNVCVHIYSSDDVDVTDLANRIDSQLLYLLNGKSS